VRSCLRKRSGREREKQKEVEEGERKERKSLLNSFMRIDGIKQREKTGEEARKKGGFAPLGERRRTGWVGSSSRWKRYELGFGDKAICSSLRPSVCRWARAR